MTVTRNTHYLAHFVHFGMSDLPSTPRTWSGRHSSLPAAGNIAGLPTLSKQCPEEPFLDDPEPSVSVPAPTASPGIINPATFQQQMLNIMTKLGESIPGQRTRRETTSASTRDSNKEPKAKDPETFHGNRETLNIFFTECQLVFIIQPSRFGNDNTKINYMVSFLRGTPMVAICPYIMSDPCPDFLEDFDLFVAYLRTNYGDPDELGTARRKLKALCQTSSAASYFAKFQQYLAISDGKIKTQSSIELLTASSCILKTKSLASVTVLLLLQA